MDQAFKALAGLVTERRAGTRRLYRARPDGLAAVRLYLDDMWAGDVDPFPGRKTGGRSAPGTGIGEA